MVDISLIHGVSLCKEVLNIRSRHDSFGELVKGYVIVIDVVLGANFEGSIPVGASVVEKFLGIFRFSFPVSFNHVSEHVVEIGIVLEARDDFILFVFLFDSPEVSSVELSSSISWNGGSGTLEKASKHC